MFIFTIFEITTFSSGKLETNFNKEQGNSVKCIKLRTKWRNFVILVTLSSGYWEHCFRVNKLSISIGRIGVEIKGRNGDGGWDHDEIEGHGQEW